MTFEKLLYLLFPLLCLPNTNVNARPGDSESRQADLHKLVLDLQNPAVVVFVALRPGTEDFTALSYLQLGRGAKVATIFITNGESVPNDLADENHRFTAGRRKEEAYESATLLGTQAYFLNLPDPGGLANDKELRRLWNNDTLSNRLTSVLESFHPDFIFLTRDVLLGESSSLSLGYLRETLLRVISQMSSPSANKKGQAVASVRGPSPRVFFDDGTLRQKYQFDGSFKLQYPRKKVVEIGNEAAGLYGSLRWQAAHLTSAKRGYTLLEPRLKTPPASFDSGVPIVPSELKGVAAQITAFARQVERQRSENLLAPLQKVVDTLERAIQSRGAKLPLHDQGILARWKNELEDLRCALLGVDCDVSLSDSLVAVTQLFSLDIKSFTPRLKHGSAQIYIPKVNDVEWIVNETLEKRFPFDGPVQYHILTPENLPKNAPSWSDGLLAPRMRLSFLFIIVHRDSIRERSFIYRKEIPLKTSMAQSFGLLHEAVAIRTNEPLAFRIENVSHDLVRGAFQVRDSLLEKATKTVFVPGRGELLDTMQLSWKDSLPSGEYPAQIWVSKKEAHRFVGRKFPCVTPNIGTVGIISALDQTPLIAAVRRLGLIPRLLDVNADSSLNMVDLQAIIIDRDVFAGDGRFTRREDELRRWVQAGGRLVLLPQFHARTAPFSDHELPRFQEGKVLDPYAELLVDTTTQMMRAPNILRDDDWDGWAFAKAYGFLTLVDSSSEISIRAKQSGLPLLSTTRVGQGLIHCVALDLETQLSDIVPGAYRLLANILNAK